MMYDPVAPLSVTAFGATFGGPATPRVYVPVYVPAAALPEESTAVVPEVSCSSQNREGLSARTAEK
jgi:hypothetical protein